MDTDLKSLKRDLTAKLMECSRRLNAASTPEEMKAAVAERRRLSASMSVVNASLDRVRLDNTAR